MKSFKLLLPLLFLFTIGYGQTTPWSTSPAITGQTRTFSGSPQIRWLFGSNLFSLPDTLAKLKLKSDSTANSGYVTHGYFNSHGILNFNNGLINNSDTISFGGEITNNISIPIDYDIADLSFGDSDFNSYITIQPSVSSPQAGMKAGTTNSHAFLNVFDTNAVLDATSNATGDLSLTLDTLTGITLNDGIYHKGIVYSSDYSANFTNNSLITKLFATNNFAPISGGTIYQVWHGGGSGYNFVDLTTNVSNVLPLSQSGGGSTAGYIPFSNGINLTQDSNLFWDNVNKYLGVEGVPSYPLDVHGSARVEGTAIIGSLTGYIKGSSGTLSAVTTIPYSDITGGPTSLPPSGSAGGDLTGTYPNPTISTINSITKSYYDPTSSIQTQINSKQASGNYITALTGEATASGPGSSSVTLANSAVIGKVLTGYTSGAGTVLATDNILQAIQKLNGNIGALTTGVSSFNSRTGAVIPVAGDYASLTETYTNKNLTSGTNTFPTFNQNTTGNAATVTTNANLTGDITSTGNSTTYNNVLPSSKGGAGSINGILKANGSGTTSLANSGTDYVIPSVTTLSSLTTVAGGTFGSNAFSSTSYVPTTITVAGFPLSSNVALGGLSATDATLTFSGAYNGSTTRTIGLNLSNANIWTNYIGVSYNTAGVAPSTSSISGTTSWGNNYTFGGGETDLFTNAGSAGTAGGLNIYSVPNGGGSATLMSQLLESGLTITGHILPTLVSNATSVGGVYVFDNSNNELKYRSLTQLASDLGAIGIPSGSDGQIVSYYDGGVPVAIGRLNMQNAYSYFTPTTGTTASLANNAYNIINPSGTLLALTLQLPSSPVDGDMVWIKFTQNITTVTYSNGTVVDGITAPTAGGFTVLMYRSTSNSWY